MDLKELLETIKSKKFKEMTSCEDPDDIKESVGKSIFENYKEAQEQFEIIESAVEEMAIQNNMDPETLWGEFENLSDEELIQFAEDSKGYKSETGGLTQKGRDHYNHETGSHLKAPVTTPPSKLKRGSKASKRRKSFCARMSGLKGPMKKPNGKPTRKALALRKWNC
jgi:hypothetical protein